MLSVKRYLKEIKALKTQYMTTELEPSITLWRFHLDSRLTLVHILFHIHVKYLLGVVLHLSTYLVVMLSLSREIFTNQSCTLRFAPSGPLVWNSLP